MKKQAILIIAHNNIWTLKKIIQILDSEYFDIFIHLDKKSNLTEEEFKNFCKKSKLYMDKEINVRWSDFSMIESELFLLKKATTTNHYSYYHLISGADLPIKKAKEIYSFFEKNKGKEFIHFDSFIISDKKLSRLKYYYKFIKYSRKSKCLRILEKISIMIQKLCFINRVKNYKIELKSGAQWFSITDDFANYILENQSQIKKIFQNTFAPDESVIQTLLYNSKFINNLYNKDYNNNYESCMRLIDWNRGNPYTYTEADYHLIKNSNCMFARKFDEKKDKKIIDKIYQELTK